MLLECEVNLVTSQSSEQALISCAADGDLEAFNQLVLNYQHIVYRYACTMTDNFDVADDITQETFIKAFRNIRNFRGGSFRSWVLAIATNTSNDVWRRFKRHPQLELFPVDEYGDEIDSPGWLVDPAASVETIVEHHEESDHLNRLLDGLPAVYRSVIMLVDIYEMDYVETALVLNIPLGTVKSRLTRARMKMKDGLQSASRESLSMRKCLPIAG
jgi:RNA polymerase sigma factor (sigma-70 family)